MDSDHDEGAKPLLESLGDPTVWDKRAEPPSGGREETNYRVSLGDSKPTSWVKRARGFRLYTSRGKRLVDLSLGGGTAILGHKASSLVKELKSVMERGLFTPLPSIEERRFIAALSRLFPAHTFFIYNSSAPLSRRCGASLPRWRPFVSATDPFSTFNLAAFIPILPFPLSPTVISCREASALEPPPPPSELISPILLAGAARGIYDLLAAAPMRAKPALPRIDALFSGGSCGVWRRRGLYLRFMAPSASYAPLFRLFLEAGFLLPPSPFLPLILPNGLSDGEEAALASALRAH
jgi:hypothetical protein